MNNEFSAGLAPQKPETEQPSEQLTPAQIDARHARQLLERVLSHLERGERAQALLSCKQTLHLAPHCALAHSVAGLLASLESDWKAAAQAYEEAVGNFGEGSVERARLVMLREALATHKTPEVAMLLPNISGEIVRLRAAVHAAPLAAFMNDGAPRAVQSGPNSSAPSPDGAPRSRRVSTPLINALAAALIAGLLSFLVVHALRSGETTALPAPESSAPVSNVATSEAAPPASTSAASSGTANAVGNSTAPATTPVAVTTPTPVVPSRSNPAPAAHSTPVAPAHPVTPALPHPTLPQPAASTPHPTPVPHPTPDEPAMPPMPPPRVVLPSAGHAPPEYPRVLPPS